MRSRSGKGINITKKKPEYILTLDSDQAIEILNALEAVMRWKLRQPEIMEESLPDRLDWKGDFDKSLRLRDTIRKKLKEANDIAIPELANRYTLKDAQWHRIYNIYQALRHARQQAEFPESKGVDSYPTYPSGSEPMPKVEWKMKDE